MRELLVISNKIQTGMVLGQSERTFTLVTPFHSICQIAQHQQTPVLTNFSRVQAESILVFFSISLSSYVDIAFGSIF